jgi:starch synthase (maltosyl-transferring)
VTGVGPLVDSGTRPVKSVVDEEFAVTATVFREGHDAVNATAVITDPGGREHRQPMTRVNPGLDAWAATVSADRVGYWSYRVEGWSDPYGSWYHDAVIKVGANIDVELMLEEGARVLERAAAAAGRTPEQEKTLTDAAGGLRDTRSTPGERLGAGIAPGVRQELAQRPLREFVTASDDYPWLVERERALYGASMSST